MLKNITIARFIMIIIDNLILKKIEIKSFNIDHKKILTNDCSIKEFLQLTTYFLIIYNDF